MCKFLLYLNPTCVELSVVVQTIPHATSDLYWFAPQVSSLRQETLFHLVFTLYLYQGKLTFNF